MINKVYAYLGRVDSVYNVSDWEGRSLECVDCLKPILEGEAIIGDKYAYDSLDGGGTITDWSHSRCYVPWESPMLDLRDEPNDD